MKAARGVRALLGAAAITLGIVASATAGEIPFIDLDPTRRIQPPQFANPERVTILGYNEDAMEPFITRDGKHLFFNNSNAPTINTNLFQATRIDDLTFKFDGEIGGVNTAALDAVASMDSSGSFYFVSTRSYASTASTIYRGVFLSGAVTGVGLAPGVSLEQPGIVDFDEEISADGNTLYFSEGRFSGGPVPDTAKILFAQRSGSGFVRPRKAKAIMRRINTPTLNYAADISASELEIFFTRFDPGGPAIYTASRASKTKPFGKPRKITAITGFAEAPSISADSKSLYYHKNEAGVFVIYRVTRP